MAYYDVTVNILAVRTVEATSPEEAVKAALIKPEHDFELKQELMNITHILDAYDPEETH